MGNRRSFTLVETLLAVGLSLMLVAIVTQMARNFLFGFIWGEETMNAVREASVVLWSLRRDLTRVGLTAGGSELAVQVTSSTATIELPSSPDPQRIEYRFDPAAGILWRQVSDQPAQPLGSGAVKAFAVSPVFLCRRFGPSFVLTSQLDPGEVPWRAGMRVRLSIQGPELSGAGGSDHRLSFDTHIFPVFANQRLASVWRPI